MKAKKVPLRQCSGCNDRKPKQELVRIVKTPGGEIILDLTRRVSGRGAYLCKNPDCLKKAKKSGRIDKSLSTKIPSQLYDDLEEGLKLGK